MPLEFLRELASADLPITVEGEPQVDKLRVLAAAGMVTAQLPKPGSAEPATVLTVTGLVRATLKVHPARRKVKLPLPLLDI